MADPSVREEKRQRRIKQLMSSDKSRAEAEQYLWGLMTVRIGDFDSRYRDGYSTLRHGVCVRTIDYYKPSSRNIKPAIIDDHSNNRPLHIDQNIDVGTAASCLLPNNTQTVAGPSAMPTRIEPPEQSERTPRSNKGIRHAMHNPSLRKLAHNILDTYYDYGIEGVKKNPAFSSLLKSFVSAIDSIVDCGRNNAEVVKCDTALGNSLTDIAQQLELDDEKGRDTGLAKRA